MQLTWQDVQTDTQSLAHNLKKRFGSLDGWTCMAVTRGGLIPMGLLAYQLNLRTIESINIKSYDDRQQNAIQFIQPPKHLAESRILVVDDLSDTGKTFQEIRKFYPQALYTCLYVKPSGKKLTDIYVREIPQDVWVTFPWDNLG